jgi:uncharacterized protein YqhQ
MASFQYGGQALIEGVLMRGRSALAVALRHPDHSIVWAEERLDLGLRAHRAMRLPFMRGLVVLYDTLVSGTRWLVRSATVQALGIEAATRAGGPGIGDSLLATVTTPALLSMAEPSSTGNEAHSGGGPGKGFTAAVAVMLLLSLAVGVGIFFLLPLLLAQATIGRVDQGLGFQLTEGLIRVAIFIGYLVLMARAPDVRRTFQYHGAEHMSIHALEAGDPLTVEAARRYPTAHPRCGTEFLVVVLIVSILAFALVGSLSPLWLIASRVLLIPVIAAVSYEILQLGARHRGHASVRLLWSPGIWVQKITTRQPTDDMIEVAIVSLQRALTADGAEIPAGSAAIAARPMASPGEAAGVPGSDPIPAAGPAGEGGADLAPRPGRTGGDRP